MLWEWWRELRGGFWRCLYTGDGMFRRNRVRELLDEGFYSLLDAVPGCSSVLREL